MRVGIIGLGLMGGSIGLALKASSKNYHIIGHDHNSKHCEEALDLDLVDEISTTLDNIITCDIIILSIPVNGIIQSLQTLMNVDHNCTIIDLGSTKAKIVSSVPDKIRRNFVAAHPMTGTEKFGPTAALANLYRGKVVVICDIDDSGIHQKEVALELFSQLAMNIVFMGAKEHDRHAAFISHMPHALSFSLANAVMRQEDPRSIIALAGGGFRDMSRIAKSSPDMWIDVFKQNKTDLLTAISCFKDELDKCQELVEAEDWNALNKWMKNANKLHDIL